MTEKIDTLIIGGGQAGLALSYYLRQQERPHIILEQAAQCAEAWRHHRWDSFTLVTPNWSVRMPGAEYNGPDPDGFMPLPEVVRYFEDYIERYNLPIRYNVRATRVRREEGSWIVETTADPFQAKNVVIATGTYQKTKIPDYAKNIDPSIQQLHSDEYRNPSALVHGAVLVLGSGQSGCQIAEELYQSGRKVYLSTGTTIRVPRRYRGRDIFGWLGELGMFTQTVDQLESPQEKFESNPMISGKDGGHSLNLHQFTRDGVTLLGRVQSATRDKVFFAPDLYSNLQRSDKPETGIKKAIDGIIMERGLDVPAENPSEPLRDGYDTPLVTELDLHAHGITTIIWATGYIYDFAWIELPLFDGDGFPIQTRGVTTIPGFYFLGFKWLHTAKSNLLLGVGEDAEYLAEQIEKSWMAKRYTRQEFLSRLRAEIACGKPLVMTGAGNGIAAKFIERGGVDILGVYNTGYFRMQGYGSLAGMLPMADANEMVYNIGRREVLPQVREVPVIAGLNGVDVLRDMKLFLEDCKRVGFSGVHNFPTVAWFDGDFRKTLEATGLGYQHEINMLNHARELDMLTIGYAFNETDAEFLMQYAMPDIFIYHAGITRGGSTGYDSSQSLLDMAARSQAHYDIAKRFKPDIILLAHGAALENPDDAQYMLDHTDCHGIQLGSSIERLAIEEPLQARAASFKQTSFRKTRV